MASPGNPNQPGGGPFDMNKFFKPAAVPPPLPSSSSGVSSSGVSTSTASNPQQNPNFISGGQFPPPSAASYPPPTGSPGGPYSYPLQASHYHHQPPPPPQFHHHNHHLAQPEQYQQRSMSFPTPPLQPPLYQNPQIPISSGNLQSNSAGGARLMALLSAPQPSSHVDLSHQQAVSAPQIQPTVSGGSDFSTSQNLALLNSTPNMGFPLPGPMRMPSSKLPKGRHLIGDNVLYDIDVRHPGEVQPQLEVTPITKYISDPGLVLGRQIAVNKTYICYGLKLGAIRVLNINTALRSLLKGLAQRVTDMAFFAEDVHLLASASVDGRVYVWKIGEGPDEEEKPQINGKIVIAVQFTGDGESVHPRVCWHCHKQEVLVVGIGKHVLKIDTTKVGKGEIYSTEEPLRCPVDKLIDGIQLVGSHDGEVTDLSMCQWMTTRLVSASADGTIKIWEDRKMLPIAVLRPHDGHPVNSVTFIAAPNRPDHIILITGGPLNKEVKIWASASEEGWLLPSDSEQWICTQKLELRSSAEESFFNQVVALPQAGLLLLANAKKNAIYAVHLDFGSNPASTRMDYIAEFTVTMPILSFTGTSDLLPHGEQIVQVYCVQTQAIQQYALDLSQCLPPPMENPVLEKSDSIPPRDAVNYEGLASQELFENRATEIPVSASTPKFSERDIASDNAVTAVMPKVSTATVETVPSKDYAASTVESKPTSLPPITASMDIPPPPLPLSPRLSRNLSGLRSPLKSLDPPVGSSLSDRGDPKVVEYSVDRQMDAIHSTLSDVPSQDNELRSDDTSPSLNHPVQFKHPTHLVTPSEILMATTSSEMNHITEPKSGSDLNIQDVGINSDSRNLEVEVKVVGETKFGQSSDVGSHEDLHNFVSENKEKSFYSQASDLGIEMARESHALSPETYIVEESRQFDGTSIEALRQPSIIEQEEHESSKETKLVDSGMPLVQQTPTSNSKAKKQKGKNNQGPNSSSPFDSTDSSNEVGGCSSITSDSVLSQMLAMQESINQLMGVQKDLQKQMNTMVTVPVTKEVKKLEAALGKHTEKAVKANSDALWARFLEEHVKQEKSSRERTQQTANLINNCLNKDLPAMVEKTVKKEIGSVSQAVARTIAPTIEKAVSTAIAEAFQKGVVDKAVSQLEKSITAKLEPTVARQIQVQFQTSGKQVLHETLKAGLESLVFPAFEKACGLMFEQIDAAFQKGFAEHASAALQQVESSHLPLAIALRDTINSASSMTQSLSGELADGHRKLLAVAVAGANSKAGNPLVSQLTNGPLAGLQEKIEAPVDPMKELSRLVAERKYEEAFNAALQRSDVSIVSWLCSQHVDSPPLMIYTSLYSQKGWVWDAGTRQYGIPTRIPVAPYQGENRSEAELKSYRPWSDATPEGRGVIDHEDSYEGPILKFEVSYILNTQRLSVHHLLLDKDKQLYQGQGYEVFEQEWKLIEMIPGIFEIMNYRQMLHQWINHGQYFTMTPYRYFLLIRRVTYWLVPHMQHVIGGFIAGGGIFRIQDLLGGLDYPIYIRVSNESGPTANSRYLEKLEVFLTTDMRILERTQGFHHVWPKVKNSHELDICLSN